MSSSLGNELILRNAFPRGSGNDMYDIVLELTDSNGNPVDARNLQLSPAIEDALIPLVVASFEAHLSHVSPTSPLAGLAERMTHITLEKRPDGTCQVLESGQPVIDASQILLTQERVNDLRVRHVGWRGERIRDAMYLAEDLLRGRSVEWHQVGGNSNPNGHHSRSSTFIPSGQSSPPPAPPLSSQTSTNTPLIPTPSPLPPNANTPITTTSQQIPPAPPLNVNPPIATTSNQTPSLLPPNANTPITTTSHQIPPAPPLNVNPPIATTSHQIPPAPPLANTPITTSSSSSLLPLPNSLLHQQPLPDSQLNDTKRELRNSYFRFVQTPFTLSNSNHPITLQDVYEPRGDEGRVIGEHLRGALSNIRDGRTLERDQEILWKRVQEYFFHIQRGVNNPWSQALFQNHTEYSNAYSVWSALPQLFSTLDASIRMQLGMIFFRAFLERHQIREDDFHNIQHFVPARQSAVVRSLWSFDPNNQTSS